MNKESGGSGGVVVLTTASGKDKNSLIIKSSVQFTDVKHLQKSNDALNNTTTTAGAASSSSPSAYSDTSNMISSSSPSSDHLTSQQPLWIRIKKMKSLESFWTLSVVGSTILICPAVILISLDPTRVPDLNSSDPIYLASAITNVIRFSFWFTCCWLSFILLHFGINASPHLITKSVTATYGYCSEDISRRLDYLPALHNWLVVAILFTLNTPIFCIIFAQYPLVTAWQNIVNLLLVILCLSICLLLQRVWVQKIAYDFHRVAYKDRLEKSKKDSKVLDVLKKAIKKVGMVELLMDPLSNSLRVKSDSSFPGTTSPGTSIQRSQTQQRTNITHFFSGGGHGRNSTTNTTTANGVHHRKASEEVLVVPPLYVETKLNPPEEEIPKIIPNVLLSDAVKSDSEDSVLINVEGEGNGEAAANTPSSITPSPETSSPASQQQSSSPGDDKERISDSPKKLDYSEAESTHSSIKGGTASNTISEVRIGGVKRKNRSLVLSNDIEAKKLSERLWSALIRQKLSKNPPVSQEKTMLPIEVESSSFLPFFAKAEDAKEAFDLFDLNHSGTLTHEEVKAVITQTYKERRDLNASLNDLSQALGHLNLILYGFTFFITFLIALPIYGISLNAVLPFTSFFLALSFIFGGSAKTAFDCIIFLFVTHPFDSGDRVIIDGVGYIVLELSLLTTILRTDGKITYTPNSQLASKSIVNIRRSGDLTEFVKLEVPFDTSEGKMHQLQQLMITHAKGTQARLRPLVNMELTEVACHLTYQFSIEYKNGIFQEGKRGKTKHDFMAALHKAMLEVGVTGSVCCKD